MLLELLIPTYNREKDLMANLHHLKKQIKNGNHQSEVGIVICDNCSADDTSLSVKAFIYHNPDIKIKYHCQPENVGLEKNAVAVFEMASAGHIMFIGDDDLIATGYLDFCVEQLIVNPNLGCVISGLKSVSKKGEETMGRIEKFEYKYLEKGYASVFKYSHLAHQMSGLVLKNDNVLSAYLSKPEFRNPYLFIYFAAYHLLRHPCIYAPSFKTAVCIDNEKDWGYNEIGLLDEIFKTYHILKGSLSASRVVDLMVQFMRMHSYRLNFKSSPIRLYKAIMAFSPKLKGFKRKVIILLTKEYLLRLIKK